MDAYLLHPCSRPALSVYRPSMANAGNCSCVVGIPSIHGHKKTRRALLLRRVLPPHEADSSERNTNDFPTYATPQRNMHARMPLLHRNVGLG